MVLGLHEFAGECDRRIDIHAVVAVGIAEIGFARTHDIVVRIQVKSLVVLKHADCVAGSVEDEEAERGCIAVLADLTRVIRWFSLSTQSGKAVSALLTIRLL
jgi:hypothetical protein